MNRPVYQKKTIEKLKSRVEGRGSRGEGVEGVLEISTSDLFFWKNTAHALSWYATLDGWEVEEK